MKRSQPMEEVRREGREEGRAAGREEGREEGALDALQRMLLQLGESRFGRSPGAVRRLQGIADSERLEQLVERILEVGSWKELLETP